MTKYIVSFNIVFGNGERRANTASLHTEEDTEGYQFKKNLTDWLNDIAHSQGGEYADVIRFSRQTAKP